MHHPVIVIHGGAGPLTPFIKDNEQAIRTALESIVKTGYDMLTNGASAVDAVSECVRLLEDDPLFNAGRGSALNAKGEARMDAMIMDGHTLKAGGVAGQMQAKNRILLARAVMSDTPYILLTGESLAELGAYKGWLRPTQGYFITSYRSEELLGIKTKQGNNHQTVTDSIIQMGDTVGAVALDNKGNLAAATSTGGLPACIPGRISDSCVAGAGCYANNQTCAVSATGDGEYILTHLTAHAVSMMLELKGEPIGLACSRLVNQPSAQDSDVGMISIDKEGTVGIAYNTERMPRAWINTRGQMENHLY